MNNELNWQDRVASPQARYLFRSYGRIMELAGQFGDLVTHPEIDAELKVRISHVCGILDGICGGHILRSDASISRYLEEIVSGVNQSELGDQFKIDMIDSLLKAQYLSAKLGLTQDQLDLEENWSLVRNVATTEFEESP